MKFDKDRNWEWDKTKAVLEKAYKEIDIARESLDGNHAILISFPIIYKPFYKNKEVYHVKEKIFKKTDFLCLNPKLKDETYQKWERYRRHYTKIFFTLEWFKEKANTSIASNDNFWLDMEILKKEICKKYAKF